MNEDSIKKIAIVRLSALGDIVHSAVVLQFIKQKYPHVKIEWIVEESFSSLLLSHPLLDSVHTVTIKALKKTKSFSTLKKIITQLLSLKGYDRIIDMQGLIKSSIVARLLGKNTHGFDKESIREPFATFFYATSSHILYEENIVKRNTFVVGDALNFEITQEMILNKEPIFPYEKNNFRQSDKKRVAFVIGASWKSKIYPKEKILTICNALKENIFIIWGTQQEKEDAQWICARSDDASLAPAMSLTALVTFVSSLDLLIGNDTGPTHMAWAQNIASITLFGPTTSRMMFETPKNIAIKSSSTVNILKIDKNDFSIEDIKEQDIIQQAQGLLYAL